MAELEALPGRLFVVSAPSGGGKSTLIGEALQRLRPWGSWEFSISHTTRLPREGEENGREYHFVTDQRFDEMVALGAFLEFAQVHGHQYGTSYDEVIQRLKKGRDVILDIDVQGALQVFVKEPAALGIFITPPSFPELERRLTSRGLDSESVVERRLAAARGEMLHYVHYPYVIINDEKERAVQELMAILLTPKLERPRQEDLMQSILKTFE